MSRSISRIVAEMMIIIWILNKNTNQVCQILLICLLYTHLALVLEELHLNLENLKENTWILNLFRFFIRVK